MQLKSSAFEKNSIPDRAGTRETLPQHCPQNPKSRQSLQRGEPPQRAASKIQNRYGFGYAVVSSSSLAAILVSLGTSSASAQVTPFQIQSTGTISGTIELPNFNPNFNNRVTRIDTDSSGTYYRNIGSKNNPNNVAVYQSQYVQVQTRKDGSLGYFVDFLGIPVVSFDGILASPALSGGKLTTYKYQGKLPVKFQGAVQDEFGLQKAFYTGIVTDPKTGKQYEGTFEVNGQGPRYSDRKGGESPTVFDFKSDFDPKQYNINAGIKPKPTVTSYKMTNTPLVRLTITVPADAKLITPSSGGTTPTTGGGTTPTTGGGTTPTTGGGTTPTTGGGTTPTTGGGTTPTTGGGTTPTTGGGTTPTTGGGTTPTTGGGTTPIIGGSGTTTTVSSGSTLSASPTSPTPSLPPSPLSPEGAPSSPTPSPTATPDMEFSSGNFFAVNSATVNSTSVAAAICTRDAVSCDTKASISKKAIGPRSRVLLR